MNGAPCANALQPGRAEAALGALRAAQVLTHQKLTPLERALGQNAALRLLSCSQSVTKAPLRAEMAQQAKRLIKALALSKDEIAALPSSAAQLSWLGADSDWQVGQVRTHLHESADGFASTVERAQHGAEFASVFRAILLDDHGELSASDVTTKLLLRRPAEAAGHFSACIATLDPTSAHCGAAVLTPVSSAFVAEALTRGDGSPACHQCHVQNHVNSLGFGPSTGLGPNTVSLDTARAPLLKALQL